jgi:hypothetical protein
LRELVLRDEVLLRGDEVFLRGVVDERVAWLPFRPDVCPDVCPELWRTRARSSSGRSDARALASSTTSFAWRENESLRSSAYMAAPDAGRSNHRVVRVGLSRCFPSAASAISDSRSA